MLETNRHSIDLSALSFWASPAAERDEAFRALRDSAPVTWQRQAEGSLLPAQEGTGGYWAVVRHADVRAVSRDAATFSAGHGVVFEDAPAELLEGSQSILAMDDPRHMKLRKLVSSAFTPRHVTQLESHIGADARTIVDQLDEDGTSYRQSPNACH